MKHVAPHRWADADAGLLPPAEVDALESHAERCPRCAAARDKVLAVRDGFTAVREQSAPHLNWEHVGARIYWVTSSERRAATRRDGEGRRLLRWGLIAAGSAAAAAVILLTLDRGASPVTTAVAPPASPDVHLPAPDAPAPPPEASPAPAAPLTGVVTYLQGAVELDGVELGIDARIAPGARLHTAADGRVAFQIGDASGVLLESGSTLQLRAFDERTVELAVDGEVAVTLAPRRPDQRFAIVAGERTVTVRGTAFRVRHRDGSVQVDCSHGRVVVSGVGGEVAVGAGESLVLPDGGALA
ncbi:MAG TPA: FecR domain-containing protein, partial [Kofleriaceae bacterium]|nr:FecR domain-containing protein [Kofleriaceae bacterium]